MMNPNPTVPQTMASPMKVWRRMTSWRMLTWDSRPPESSESSDSARGAWKRSVRCWEKNDK